MIKPEGLESVEDYEKRTRRVYIGPAIIAPASTYQKDHRIAQVERGRLTSFLPGDRRAMTSTDGLIHTGILFILPNPPDKE